MADSAHSDKSEAESRDWLADARSRYKLPSNYSYPSRVAANNVHQFILDFADAYERALIQLDATQKGYVKDHTALSECQRVLSLFLDRFDDASPWLPGEYREMAGDCLKDSTFARRDSEHCGDGNAELAEEIEAASKPLKSLAGEAIDLTVKLLRETARRHPEILQDTDIEAFILNELNPAKVMADKDRRSCYGLMGLLAKARAQSATREPSQDWKDIFDEYRNMERTDAWLYRQIEAHSRRASSSTERGPSPAGKHGEVIHLPDGLNADTQLLVMLFAEALAYKLRRAEEKYGYDSGWKAADWEGECRERLYEHLQKGDPRDVANYCAFMWHHGWSTKRP